MDSKELHPDYYVDESPEAAVQGTMVTIEHIKKIDPEYDLISPIVTPRFAPSCTTECLSGLGRLAREENLPVQTHLSENAAEVRLVAKLFPQAESYTDVYERHGLLGEKTVLAHAVHLSPEERKIIASRAASVSHCPVSNTSLGSGLCPVRTLLDEGITVGLGTDVSGGYSCSILEAARQACLVSRLLAFTKGGEDGAKLSVEEVLYLGTRGGAKALGLETKVGAFQEMMEWDAQLVDLGEEGKANGRRNVELFGRETWEEKIAKWVFCGDDRNTVGVWCRGRQVFRK